VSGKRDIGDPLEQTIATGKIGSTRQTLNNLDIQQSSSPNTQNSGILDAQNFKNLDTQISSSLNTQAVKRTQQTIYLPTDLTKWLRKRAIDEDRQISDIVAELVARYREECI